MSSDSQPSTSGRGTLASLHPLPTPPSTATLALTIAGAAVAGAVIWHFSRETYYAYVPPKVRSCRCCLNPRCLAVAHKPDDQEACLRGQRGSGSTAAANLLPSVGCPAVVLLI